MLAGECFGNAEMRHILVKSQMVDPITLLMPHASKTEDQAFMSVYAWIGDLSTDAYEYSGLPQR